MGDITNTMTQAGEAFRILNDLNSNNASSISPVRPHSDFPSVFYEEKLKSEPPKEQESGGKSFVSPDNRESTNKKSKINTDELPELFQLIFDDKISKFMHLWGGNGEFDQMLIVKNKRNKRGITMLQPTILYTNTTEKVPKSLLHAYLNSDNVFKNYKGAEFTGTL